MSFHLDPIWSYPLVILAIVGLVALVLLTYPERVRHLPLPWQRGLLGLRLATAVVLGLAMLRPEIQHQERDEKPRVMLIAADISRSMTTRDAPGGLSRREALIKTLSDSEELLTRLGEKIEIRYFDFSDALTGVETLSHEAEGPQTAMGAILEQAMKEVSREQLVGLLLMGDGAQRALPPLEASPREVAGRIGNHPTHRVPISTIVYGSTELQGAVDVSVEDVIIAPEPFVKTTVPVSARIRAFGAAGKELTVRVLLEDRTGKQPGETGELKELPASRNAQPVIKIKPTKNNELIPVELSFVPELPGEFKLAIRVETIEGELKLTNNEQATIISVRKGGVKIAYFDKPYWEQKYIQRANRSQKIDIDFVPIRPVPFLASNRIDPQMFKPGEYDAYIIGDVPAKVFGSAMLSELADRVREGAGLLMLGGFRTFGPGGYIGTEIESLLPVRMTGTPLSDFTEVTDTHHYMRDLKMLPTREGLAHFIMRLDSSENNQKHWAELSPLQSANRLEEKNAAVQVLAATDETYPRQGTPLLFMHEVGAARVMVFAGDTTWQWVMDGHETDHQRFWQQMILYLARKEMDGEQAIWAKVNPRSFSPNQNVTIEMGARNEQGLPIADADFKTFVIAPEKPEESLTPRQSGETHLAEYTSTTKPGDYWVRVSGTKDGTSLGPDGWTRFLVSSRDLELDHPAADPELMRDIASATGGRFLRPEELNSYLEELLNDPPQTLLSRITRTRLWDNWWFLCLFVGLMSLEWYFRKRRGLV